MKKFAIAILLFVYGSVHAQAELYHIVRVNTEDTVKTFYSCSASFDSVGENATFIAICNNSKEESEFREVATSRKMDIVIETPTESFKSDSCHFVGSSSGQFGTIFDFDCTKPKG